MPTGAHSTHSFTFHKNLGQEATWFFQEAALAMAGHKRIGTWLGPSSLQWHKPTVHTSGTVGLLGHSRVQGQLRGRIKGIEVGENNPPYGPCCQGGHSVQPQSVLMPTNEIPPPTLHSGSLVFSVPFSFPIHPHKNLAQQVAREEET